MQKKNLNTTNPHQDFLQFFCRPLLLTNERPSSVNQFVFIKLLLPELISKKAPSNPWIADNSRKKSAQGWDLHLKFILLSSKKVDGSKTKRQTSKNTWTPIHTHEQPWTSMDAHEHSSAHEHPWTHMNSCFSKYNAAGKLLVEPSVSQFLSSYFGLLAMRVFDLIVFFLNWTLFIFLCVMFFLFCPVVASCPKKILADFCKTWFLINIYVYSHSFIYSNINMYIYIYVMLCIFIYSIISIYIYTCVCVCGGGCLKMRCPFFLSKNPFWNQKNTSFWDISMYIQYIYFLTCVFCFYPGLVCPIQNIWFLFFFCM